MKKIVVITPVYNEALGLEQYKNAVVAQLFSKREFDYEVLFVDDGSSDGSWDMIQKICATDNRFKAIRLSRNFGPHIALSAGINSIKNCDAIATLACDLQDPPQAINDFATKWKNENVKIVWGKRKERKDALWRRFMSKTFFVLIKRYAMPKGSLFQTGSFFLIDKQVKDAYDLFHERSRITFAIVAYTGFKQDVVEYSREKRCAGKSKWSFSKMIRAMVDTFIGFSDVPVRLMSMIGFALMVLNSFFIFYLLFQWFFNSVSIKGWTGIMVSISFFSGVILMFLGVIGEYLRRIYHESVKRPLYFISEKIDE